MTGDAVKEIERLAREAAGKVVAIDGLEYATTPLHRFKAPEPDPVVVHTLSGLAAYAATEDEYALTAHVVSPDQVRLVDQDRKPDHRRFCYARASWPDLFGGTFKFGQFLSTETFIIGLLSLFEDSPQRAAVLAIVGNLKDEAVRQVSDDGVTQTVTARAGVVIAKELAIPRTVALRPFRTFRDVKQPISEFVLRLQGGGNGQPPTAALFEADGGAWRIEAMGLIADYLRENLAKDVTVIA